MREICQLNVWLNETVIATWTIDQASFHAMGIVSLSCAVWQLSWLFCLPSNGNEGFFCTSLPSECTVFFAFFEAILLMIREMYRLSPSLILAMD